MAAAALARRPARPDAPRFDRAPDLGDDPGMDATILVADDDPHIREVVRFALAREGWRVVEAADGAAALRRFAEAAPDLVVLDVGMPEGDGLDVCREIRRAGRTPVLFLSARDEEIDRVLGLEIGGDDYVGKPFSPRELVARVRAILKRAAPPAPEPEEVLAHGDLALRPGPHEAEFAGRALKLTPLEFAMLAALIAKRDRVVTREEIAALAYRDRVHVSGRTIDSHIRNLRTKLAEAGCAGAVETVHGVGFRIGPCRAS